jgi:chromosome segregation ATPase
MTTKVMTMSAVLGLILSSCHVKQQEESAKLQHQVDSLVAIVEQTHEFETTLDESAALLDSIDVTRNRLRTQLWEGTSHDAFTSRVEELSQYVKKSESKIKDLESALKSSKLSGASYSERIKNMKDELEKNTKEIAALQEQVAQYKTENETLIKTVDLQQAELEDKLSQIASRQDEIAQLETRVNTILAQSKLDAADQYFARAEALELAAARTSFMATKKRKTTRQQALEMYQMAVLYGKNDAQAKVDELASKL